VRDVTDQRRARLLSDQPISTDDDDFLGYASYSTALVELINDPHTETPLTISLTGAWGAGKTSTMRLVEQRLLKTNGRRHDLVCWFDAMLHEDAPQLGVALASAVVKEINPYRRWWKRLVDPVAGPLISPFARWRRQLIIGVCSGLLAGAVIALPSSREVLQAAAGSAGKSLGTSGLATAAVLTGLFWFTVSKVFSATSGLSRFLASPRDEAARGGMHTVRDELARLIRQALRRRRRLVIVVDDVDRLPGERAMELCQAVGKLLNHPGVVAVLVGSPRTQDLDPMRGDPKYLQRLIQLPLTLPAPEYEATRAMVRRSSQRTPSAQLTVIARVKGFIKRVNPFSHGIRRPALVHYGLAAGAAAAVLLAAVVLRTFS
jgi:hypothetical protein